MVDKADKETLDVVVKVRLRASERVEWLKKAKRLRMTLSDTIRKAMGDL